MGLTILRLTEDMDPYNEEELDSDEVIEGPSLNETEEEAPEHE